MSVLISDECIACDACREECPNEAIEEGDPIYCIDPDRCTECVGSYDEPSCIAVCPVDAIVSDPDNIESMEELKYKYEQLQQGE
ncbi:YfhL family 4Fe-4S dicluster ferredoxin [uncultured Helicobacter sp.]|uniref:YfhL family 4Fe-4S dicluster ferredoxin n=1 Tax=uncultured Helicobacter sp. TaxID=175537 RepID=UPI001F9FDBAB|nr:YfhL family 4Fe-4S dicluster ferredoxin [uncultured Helicobacter sp.]HIY44177.1 YfhL family 4Fe-4S dicluster ferredoxin [Candidatus Helicobacter avistercoris]